jgi:phage shock protein A
MQTLMVFGAVVVGLILLIAIFNRKALRRLFESGNAQVGKAGRWAWSQDPAAIYQQRIDAATLEIEEATRAVEEHKGLVNSLSRQVEDGKREVAVLDARVKNSLKDDPEDKSGRAGSYVTQLQRAQENLTRNEGQYQKAMALYNNNIRKIQLARQKIKDAEAEGKQLGVELKMAKTEAAIAQLATQTNININSTDGLGEVAEEMRRQIDKERAKGEVATDLGTDGMAEIEEEERLRRASSAELLEQYKAKNLAK